MTKLLGTLIGLLALSAASLAGPGPAVAQKEVVIGLQCDRTGATQTVGVNLCPGYHDYVKLVNSKVPKFSMTRRITIGSRVTKIAPKIEPRTEP